jgi:hypothetical protein
MRRQSTQITAWIDRRADDVYTFASNPANIPQWAPGLGASVEQVEGKWLVDTPDGRLGVAFAEHNDFGVLDHEVTLPSGDVIYNPMRVIADGDGCEVIFTLRRQPDMSDADFERDAGLVQADLLRLKQVMEAGS